MDIVHLSQHLRASDVLEGYRRGMFPMGYPGRKIISWHHPKVRAILPLDSVHISRSLTRTLRKAEFTVTFNTAFLDVMKGCAARSSTWITRDIFRVYTELHALGHAHSVEVWKDDALAGGVYGVQIGGAFFAESKFHRVTDMSKVALVSLARRLSDRGFRLLEVQYLTDHLSQFGVIEVPDAHYRQLLDAALRESCVFP